MKETISGIRGIFGRDFNLNHILQYCNNFSSLAPSGSCVVGKDTRNSSGVILETAKAALMKNGINVYDLGTAPTPVIFREARKYGAGLVVTASHNPLSWNGLKFVLDGRGIVQNELDIILGDQNTTNSEIGVEAEITSTYVDDLQELVGVVQNSPRVVVDSGGGAAAEGFASNLLERIGCRVETINSRHTDHTRGSDPTTDDLKDLITMSSDREIGFAFDLDGDRLVVVKNGMKQTPDVTLGLGIVKAISMGYKKFVLSIDSSVAIERFILEHGGSVQRSKVGEANVVNMMVKTDAHAGGEGSSAGFILPSFNYCRDGMLASGFIASILGDPRLDDFLEYMNEYVQIRTKFHAENNLHDIILDKILDKSVSEFSEIDTLDGVKGIIDENNWVLVRKSNTEDVVRISGESDSLNKCKRTIDRMLELVSKCYEQAR